MSVGCSGARYQCRACGVIKQRRLGTFYLDWVGETNKPAFLLLESQRSNYFEVPKEVNFKGTYATTLI